VDRLPQLRLRLIELEKMREEYEAKGNRRTMVNYLTALIADATDEIARVKAEGQS
jgi:hypothetical protein